MSENMICDFCDSEDFFIERISKIDFRVCSECHTVNYNYLYKEIKKLKAENIKLRKGLEFYADTTNWRETEISSVKDTKIYLTVDAEVDASYPDEKISFYTGGKLARQIIREVEGEI